MKLHHSYHQFLLCCSNYRRKAFPSKSLHCTFCLKSSILCGSRCASAGLTSQQPRGLMSHRSKPSSRHQQTHSCRVFSQQFLRPFPSSRLHHFDIKISFQPIFLTSLDTATMSANTVKTSFLVLSDTHGEAFKVPSRRVDVAIHCGDLTDESKLAEFRITLDLLRTLDAPLKLTVGGG